jgi:hypothetical protein
MLKMIGAVCINLPIAKVWAVLSDLPAIQHWVPAIRQAHCPTQARGVGGGSLP